MGNQRRDLLRAIGASTATSLFGATGSERASGEPHRVGSRGAKYGVQAEQTDPPYVGSVTPVAFTDTDAFFRVELGATDTYHEYNYVGPLVFQTEGTIFHVSSLVERNQLLNTVADVTFLAGGQVLGIPVGELFNLSQWLADEVLGDGGPEGSHSMEISVAPGYDPFELLVWVTGDDPANNTTAYYDVQEIANTTQQRVQLYSGLFVEDPSDDRGQTGDETPTVERAVICDRIENEWHRSGGEHSHSHECLDERNRFAASSGPTVYFWVNLVSVPEGRYRFDWYDPSGETFGTHSGEVDSPEGREVHSEFTFWGWYEFSTAADTGTYEVEFSFDGETLATESFVLE